jgi:hypothetical protein
MEKNNINIRSNSAPPLFWMSLAEAPRASPGRSKRMRMIWRTCMTRRIFCPSFRLMFTARRFIMATDTLALTPHRSNTQTPTAGLVYQICAAIGSNGRSGFEANVLCSGGLFSPCCPEQQLLINSRGGVRLSPLARSTINRPTVPIHQSVALQPFILIGIVGGGVQLGPLGTAATNRPIMSAPVPHFT